MVKPSIGRLVHAVVDPRINNGGDVAPALITKIKPRKDGTDEESNGEKVNLRVFLDTGADLRLTNVEVLGQRPDETDPTSTQRVAFWPPRS